MATEPTTNGGDASTNLAMSAAERLRQQHEAQESHHVTVEDVPDEDTLSHAHPPASATQSLPVSTGPSRTETPAGEGPPSSKAAGKQPMREQPPAPKSSKPALDTQSEELFPALSAPKTQTTAAAPTMWSKKPALGGKATNGIPNGTANGRPAASNMPPRESAPTSGMISPGSTNGTRPTPQMSLPGRYTEAITLPLSVMKKRDQLKKPIADILRDINKRSKANVEMKNGQGEVKIFEGTGPVDAVRTALKEVAGQLCANQTITLPIPTAIRGKVVGKQGATVQSISKSSGARIHIARPDADAVDDDDPNATIDVNIEGDPFAVQIARQDIQRIVDENTSSVNTRLKHIPAEYYPFLSSRTQALSEGRDLNLRIPQYRQWKEQAPPQTPVNRGPATFAPHGGLHIELSGERQAVADARTELDRVVAELQRELTVEQTTAIERGRHQFIVGDMGTSLDDFLAETGCAVILPPDGYDSDDLYIVGPPDRIEDGLNKVYDLAASMQSASADIARQHAAAAADAQAHARAVTRYLQQRQAIEQLERQHNARIVPDSTGRWQIYARDGKNAMKARSDIMNLVSGHPPTRFSPVQVDPFYHEHLRQKAAQPIREQHGVRMIIPDESDDAPMLLVFEERTPSPEYELPRRAPSAQEAHAFQEALAQAQQHILDMISGQQEIVSRQVEAPVKFHDKIRRHVDRHHQSLPESQIPVQVLYGGSRGAAPSAKRTPAPTMGLRGPQDSVDVLLQSLQAFIEQEHKDELERGFTLNFDFPQKFASHVIGRGGENINRLREEFDVDIQLNDGKCEVKGPEAKAQVAKRHLLDVARKLEDETVHHLNVPPTYHRDLIGPQGSQVNRLQDRYNVHVQFPRTRQGGDEDGPEAGEAPPSRRVNQQPNEVIIKGPSKGADLCRDELLSLLQYVKDNSHNATVSVAQNQLPSLIGAGGREMDSLRLETGAQIDVPSAKEVGASGRAEIKIKGSKQAVDAAKRLIEERAKVFDNTVTKHLDVDRKHHRFIIGPQGSTLAGLIEQAGGPTDARSRARAVRFPKAAEEGNSIRVEGQQSVVDKLCEAIMAMAADQESQTTEIAEVKPDKHRLLIGRGGEARRQLEQQFNVSINVPRQTETGPQRSQVKINGQPGQVEKCKAHILEITKDLEGETVPVPRKYHHAIADNGQFFRRLRNDHKVTVDHAGQRPPPRPAVPTPSRANGGAMPLITDDPASNAEKHSWEMHGLHASSEAGDIPWVLSGPSPEVVAAAQAKLTKALEEASKQDTVGFLILPDPRTYRHVIGPGGSEINRIRKQTSTKIQVPRDQNKGEAIEIIGAEDGVEGARDLILEIVHNST